MGTLLYRELLMKNKLTLKQALNKLKNNELSLDDFYADVKKSIADQNEKLNVYLTLDDNALEKAKNYQDKMKLSPNAIRDQLMSDYGEKFTQGEADYAIQNLND